jgi:parvulin-like peptidyl-prolyl cis-trans isomerase-like protein
MRKSWLLFVCLGTLAWGQAQAGAPAPASPAPAQASPAPAPNAAAKPEMAAPAAEVSLTAAVLTIKGVCAPMPKPAAGKTATAKKPADCKTVITRADFEKLTAALQQGPNPLTVQQKRQLAIQLPGLIALSEAAKKKGLDKTPRFVERVKIDKMSILSNELKRVVQEDADKVPADKIAAYYKENPEAYEQFSLDRLFVPKMKQPTAEDKEDAKEEAKEKEGEKLTEEQQKAKEAAEKAKQEKGEQELTDLAASLQKRAAAGEDITKLQKEAFEAAGTKVENPTINLPKVRRTGLPAAHAAVFELKVGEVSAVISDQGGHYIYKVVSKEVLPLDQVKEEIHNKMRGERLKEMMDAYTNSYQTDTNEAYFGPAPPPGPPRRPRMTPPGAPQGAAQQPAPPAANAPAANQAPAAATPPTKPN